MICYSDIRIEYEISKCCVKPLLERQLVRILCEKNTSKSLLLDAHYKRGKNRKMPLPRRNLLLCTEKPLDIGCSVQSMILLSLTNGMNNVLGLTIQRFGS